MSRTVSVSCPRCGTLNDVLAADDSFEEQLAHAAFHLACRQCGADLPPISAGDASDPAPKKAESDPGRGSA